MLAAGKKNAEAKTEEAKKTTQNEKSGRSVGLIVTLVILGVVIIALAVVLTIILININSNNGSGDDSNKTSLVDKKDGKKDRKKDDDGKESDSDNTGIQKKSSSNGNIGDHVRGDRSSKVLVVEYADPQCPGCAAMMPRMDAIYEKYKNKVAFVYRHYPISGHVNARSAAIAIEAAGKQGFFWEMLTKVFEKRADWVRLSGENKLTDAYATIFKEVANNGNISQFKKDLKDSNLAKKVDNDKALGVKDKIYATPTIIVNGKSVDFMSTSDPQKPIEEAIEKALDGNDSTADDDDDWDWDDDEEDDDEDDDYDFDW